MLNFSLGAAAGALVAGILTIAAARQPDFQARLGLVPPPRPTAPAIARAPEVPCRPEPVTTSSVGKVQEILFNRQRFWSVAP